MTTIREIIDATLDSVPFASRQHMARRIRDSLVVDLRKYADEVANAADEAGYRGADGVGAGVLKAVDFIRRMECGKL